MAANKPNKLSLKLLIDKKGSRVLFAEAGKDVVDFLFSLLSLPIGSVTRLLNKTKMVGCIGNIYQSVENLDDIYILQPTKNKELLLKPKVASASPLNVPLLTPNETINPSTTYSYYGCGSGNYHKYVTNDPTVLCPSCRSYSMSTKLTYVPSNISTAPATSSEKGYVKEVVTYMFMDDLAVMPMSTISSITLLSKFNVENVNLLEEKVVDFGMERGLKLLKASLQTNNVLSQVFLGRKAK